MKYYSPIRKKKILPFGTIWTQREDHCMLSEINQTGKTNDIQHPLHVKSKKSKPTETE